MAGEICFEASLAATVLFLHRDFKPGEKPKDRTEMQNGFVKFFDDKRGWGFLAGENGQQVFVHYSRINGVGRRTLRHGEPVSFDIQDTEKGPMATNVTRLNPPTESATVRYEREQFNS